jgi:tyrosyl-tRNA synthetase
MQPFQSSFLKELQNRGFISQITHEKELDDLMKDQKISAYIGFDCTAKSLHIGSLIQIMILQILQSCGHRPVVLLGGGTTKIGDPSGKDEARQFLDESKIFENMAGIEATLKKFDLSETPEGKEKKWKPFKFVNNDDWLKDLKYIDFLRDFGKHFSVNRMLSFESVKLRLDRSQPLSFLEFNYMILQAYDFYELNKNMGCVLQIGGSDQWGNIVNGVDLTRRVASENLVNEVQKTGKQVAFISPEVGISAINASVFGLTTPLLTTSDGKKMGKTANGAVWLDAQMLNPFDYFQYFRNIDDANVERFFKLFTHLDLSEIEETQKEDINRQKEILAFEVSKICHGQDQALKALAQAKSIFSGQVDVDALPTKEIKFTKDEAQNGKKLVEILRDLGLCESVGEAKKLIRGGGVKVDDQKIDENFVVQFDVEKPFFKVALGKKKFFKIIINE